MVISAILRRFFGEKAEALRRKGTGFSPRSQKDDNETAVS
jgi:hypothetical protein